MDTTSDYAARLARVQSGGLGCSRTIFVGLDEAYYIPARDKPKARAADSFLINLAYPLSFVLAVCLGLIADAAGRLLRFGLMPQFKPEAATEMLINAGFGLALGLLLANLCHLKTTQHRVLLVIGVLVGGMTFHNLVHAAPQIFERLFSPLWVAEVLRSTEPHSLLVRGISFVLKG
jgi:hypothetical protein